MVYLKSVENVITLVKLIGLSCLPLLSILPARAQASRVFGRPKRAPHLGVQSRFCVIGRAKRAPLGCSIEISRDWASEASPTLGCSIEISRDICNSYKPYARFVWEL